MEPHHIANMNPYDPFATLPASSIMRSFSTALTLLKSHEFSSADPDASMITGASSASAHLASSANTRS